MQQQYEQELCLSEEALAALATFAVERRGLAVTEQTDPQELRRLVQESCNDGDRDETFEYSYGGEEGGDTQRRMIRLTGWKKELGQRLDSTGLTIWRAGEDLARYLHEKREELFHDGKGGRRVLELGAGLGLCGILASELNPHGIVVITDGDPLAMEKLVENVQANVVSNGCAVTTRLLRWGDHEELREEFPEGFDMILAADVIYEKDAVVPLLKTVMALLSDSPQSIFILSFARRNVSIVEVLDAAVQMGLCHRADDSFACSAPGEHVYLLTRASEAR